jgi:GNAT superfamily N-acetyltransferase
MMNQYSYLRSFSSDPTLSSRLFELLETVFPGVSRNAELGRVLGASWEAVSTPFVRFHDDRVVAHVGVLEIPMVVMGQMMIVGGIHGVCTHPEFRHCGYFRDCMEEAIQYCAQRYDTLILTTSIPELYKPFGFRLVEEHAFVTKCTSTGHVDGFRVLNTNDSTDRKLLDRLLEERQPVSEIVGVVNEKAVFYFNESNRPLHYAKDLDIIVSMEIEGTQLKLFDLVGTSICTLASILERIPQYIDSVTTYFSPERLNTDVQAFPHILDGDSLLMVRGSFPTEGKPFMLPRSARC